MRGSVWAIRRASYGVRLLALLSLLSSGCGGRHQDEVEADPLAPTSLTVDNNHWLDVVVFVFHDGEVSRVGTVTAASSSNFFLPAWMIGQSRNIRLIADPIGASKGTGTELIHIQPGQFIEWRLESQLARSTVSVY